ncbi:GNAT family N-acetyltransferase [Bacillus sp. JCM 19034]|uniref:GNAT family N-acetyltransferase n=1 Tax=Bacillus sp. JCM 19034 TaxID=1481928 RepID=UPI0007856301|nr:GNAT family N-acetyltransferase [Bacillus sp. JCM 19034]
MKEHFQIMDATIDDLKDIVRIYNTTIESRMVTADLEPITVESRIVWFHEHKPKTRPLWVVKDDKHTCAWVSFQSFYGRSAYDFTAEISIYIDPDYRGKGLGKYLVQYALDHCPKLKIKTVLAYIFGHNEPSLQLFKQFGFERWAHFPRVAEMEGVERDLIILGKRVVE